MSPLSQQILQTLEVLPENDQKQVLDFVEFLQSKRQKSSMAASKSVPQSFLDTAQAAIGAGEGPGDLSTNPDHMDRYGQ